MAHPAEQTLANDGVMLTEGRPAYLGTNSHCLCPNWPALVALGPPWIWGPLAHDTGAIRVAGATH